MNYSTESGLIDFVELSGGFQKICIKPNIRMDYDYIRCVANSDVRITF